MTHNESPANTNGDRSWMRSAQMPQTITVTAAVVLYDQSTEPS